MADSVDSMNRGALRSAMRVAALAAGLAVSVATCTDLGVEEPGDASAVRVTPDTVVLRLGDSALVRALPTDASSALLVQKTAAWNSDAPTVAEVTTAGLVRGLTSGVAHISATVDGLQATAVAIVSGEPTAMTLAAGEAQVAGVNEVVPIAPAVRVVDADGNGVFGVPVTFAVTGGRGTTDAVAPVRTDVAGLASVAWTLGPSPGENTLSATAAGLTLTGDPVTFTATAEVGPPNAAASSVEAAPSTIPPSDGANASTITVTVRDALGRTVTGATVTLSASGTGNVLTQPAAVTDDFGQATGTLASEVAEEKVVTATVNGSVVITQTATVTIEPGAPAAVVIVTQPGGAVSNAQFTDQPVLEIRDAFGNRHLESNGPVTVSLVHGDGVLVSGTGSLTVNAVQGLIEFSGLLIRGLRTEGDTIGMGKHVLQFDVPGMGTFESDTVNVEVSYAYNVSDVFQRECWGCHDDLSTHAGAIGPTVIPPCTGTRVVAGDSLSLLYVKMKEGPSCGAWMPFGPKNPRSGRIVRDWILQGAKNN